MGNIQSLSEIGQARSSSSVANQMEPYYSPEESAEMEAILGVPQPMKKAARRARKVQKNNQGRILPDLVSDSSKKRLKKEGSSTSIQPQREKAFYGNAVANPVLKPLASPTRK